MIYLFISLLLLLPTILGIGSLWNWQKNERISINFLYGIITITGIWAILAFFIPLDYFIEIATIILGFFSFFKTKIYKEFFFLAENRIIFSISVFIILLSASFPPYIIDHFGYYLPTIKWLTEVGLVRGISNLDLLLGQMSFWHIFSAGFSHFSDSFLRINAILLVIFIIYILEKKRWIHLFFIPFLLLFLQSPSPDLPVIILSLIVLDEVLSGNKNQQVLFALSVFIFCIKPTAIWVPAFIFGTTFLGNFKVKKLLPGLFILSLFLVKNIYSFGYPVFPVSAPEFLRFSWASNPEILKISSEIAVRKTYDMKFSVAEISRFSWLKKIENWIFLPGMKGFIHILFLVFLLIFSWYCLKGKSLTLKILWFSVVLKSILVLSFSAQYRFFLEFFFVVFFLIFNDFNLKKQSLYFSFSGSIIVIIMMAFPKFLQKSIPSFHLGNYMSGISATQIIRPASFELKKFRTYQIGNLQFNLTKDYPFMFDTSIPAISKSYLEEYQHAGIFPQKVGKNLKEGFIWRKLSKEENFKLKQIIDENSTK